VDGSSSNESHRMDLSLSKDIIRVIISDDVPILKVTRLEGRRTGHVRPLQVTLSSREDAILSLRNKNRYVESRFIKTKRLNNANFLAI